EGVGGNPREQQRDRPGRDRPDRLGQKFHQRSSVGVPFGQIRASSLAAAMPTSVERVVASKVGPITSVGASEPLAARSAITVAGTSCTELVLIARKRTIASVAPRGVGCSVSSC